MRIFFFITILSILLIFGKESYCQSAFVDSSGYYSGAYAVGFTSLLPSTFDMKSNPLWGFQFGAYSYESGHSGWKFLIGLNYGSLQEQTASNFSISGSTSLTHGSIDYIFGSFPYGKLYGLFGFIGAGYSSQEVTVTTNFYNNSDEKKTKDDAFIFECGAGYFFKTGALDAKYILLTGRGNMTGAILIGINIFVGKAP